MSVDEAVEAAKKLGGKVWVVKAQIHAGGRGKGGGVKVAKSLDEVRARAKEILGMQLKTHQTGPAGQKVHAGDLRSEEHTSELQSAVHLVCRLLLEKKKNESSLPALVLPEGGMDVG